MWSLLLLLSALGPVPATATGDKPFHHTASGFRNLYVENHDKNVFTYLRMRWFGEDEYTDYRDRVGRIPVWPVNTRWLARPTNDAVRVTWLGHSTVLIQHRGINVLTDPIFSRRASPVGFGGPKRYTPLPVYPHLLPPIDYVVISHNHYDHLDADTVERLGSDTTWLVPLGLESWFLDRGIAADSVVEMDWWETVEFEGVTISAAPSQHWSGRGLGDRFETLWASWIIDFGTHRTWFGGDTGYNAQLFADIRDRFDGFDLALIPIGAYFPRGFMRVNHVNSEESVQIHVDLDSAYSFGVHWGTFYLSGEPIDEPPARLAAELQRRGLPADAFQTWAIGETRELPVRAAREPGADTRDDRKAAPATSEPATIEPVEE
ncbi:MAG: MBL fold metallo-hydrolase [Pseudomonadota bacterium]